MFLRSIAARTYSSPTNCAFDKLDAASKALARHLHSAGVGNRLRLKPLPCGPDDDEGHVSRKQSSLLRNPPCPRLGPPGALHRGMFASLRAVVAGLVVGISAQAFPAFSQPLGQPPDTMAARVEAC